MVQKQKTSPISFKYTAQNLKLKIYILKIERNDKNQEQIFMP